jgi:hypothetical protein
MSRRFTSTSKPRAGASSLGRVQLPLNWLSSERSVKWPEALPRVTSMRASVSVANLRGVQASPGWGKGELAGEGGQVELAGGALPTARAGQVAGEATAGDTQVELGIQLAGLEAFVAHLQIGQAHAHAAAALLAIQAQAGVDAVGFRAPASRA